MWELGAPLGVLGGDALPLVCWGFLVRRAGVPASLTQPFGQWRISELKVGCSLCQRLAGPVLQGGVLLAVSWAELEARNQASVIEHVCCFSIGRLLSGDRATRPHQLPVSLELPQRWPVYRECPSCDVEPVSC